MALKPVIAVVGYADTEPGDVCDLFAQNVGCQIINAGYRLQTGGRSGVMEAACRGARASAKWTPGDIITILPGYDPGEANQYADIAIPTGLGHGRNLLVAQASAVIAVGGGPGTLSEMAFAWLMRRLVIAMRGPGWAGRLADMSLDDARKRLPQYPDDRVYGADTPEEAMKLLAELLPRYPATGLNPINVE